MVGTAETVIVRKPWCLVSIMLTISATDRELTAPVSALAEVAGRTAGWKLTCLYLPSDGGLLKLSRGLRDTMIMPGEGPYLDLLPVERAFTISNLICYDIMF